MGRSGITWPTKRRIIGVFSDEHQNRDIHRPAIAAYVEDRQRFAVTLELPTIDASARQSTADAAMPGGIGRRARL
jgi:hypothetical protein